MIQKFWTAWFRFSGCNEQPNVSLSSAEPEQTNISGFEGRVTLIVPGGKNPAFIEYQNYRQDAKQALALPDSKDVEKKILGNVKYPFRILYPHQYIESFTLQDSFFLQDDRRTFLARYLGSDLKRIADPNKLTLDGINNVRGHIPYENRQQQAVDPIPSASISLTALQSQAKLGISEGSS